MALQAQRWIVKIRIKLPISNEASRKRRPPVCREIGIESKTFLRTVATRFQCSYLRDIAHWACP